MTTVRKCLFVIVHHLHQGFAFTLDRGTPPWIDPTGVCAWLFLTIRIQTVWFEGEKLQLTLSNPALTRTKIAPYIYTIILTQTFLLTPNDMLVTAAISRWLKPSRFTSIDRVSSGMVTQKNRKIGNSGLRK